MDNKKDFCMAFGEHLLDELEAVIGENLYQNHPDLKDVYEQMILTEKVMIDYLFRNPNDKIIAQIERLQGLRNQVSNLMTDVSAM
jgi:hypothetical protein